MKSVLLLILFTFVNVFAMDQVLFQRSELTGNWFGQRYNIADQGISIEAASINDVFANVKGGQQRHTAFLGNFNFVSTFDMEKLFGLQGANVCVNVLGLTGDGFSEFIGDAQVVSNIDAPNSWKLYEAWYEHTFENNGMSVLAGLYDLNSEFDVIESAGLFINSSFGIGADISQTGENGPSIFPTTSPGIRLHWQPMDNIYFQSVVLDAIAGDPENPYGTHIHFNPSDGWFTVMEMGLLNSDSNSLYQKIAMGTWFYTSEFDEFSHPGTLGMSLSSSNNQGFYILGERCVYENNDEPEKSVSIFGRYGIANSDINQFDYYAGAGIVFNDIIALKTGDQLGIAIARAHNSQRFLQCMQYNGCQFANAETVIEITFKTEIAPWLSFQPDMQYIIDPGTIQNLGNAWVFGLRTEIIY